MRNVCCNAVQQAAILYDWSSYFRFTNLLVGPIHFQRNHWRPAIMTNQTPPASPDPDRFTRRIDELRGALLGADPYLLADHTRAVYQSLSEGRGEFRLAVWERQVAVSFPEFVARDISTQKASGPMEQALLLYYFNIADGVPLARRWISFSELPDGRFYNQAFQGYTGRYLARTFENKQQAFEQAAKSLGGEAYSLGDAAFGFWALPCVPLMVVFWRGDDEFPSSVQILFNASASHYLPTDAYAILGSALTRRLSTAKEP
jgi:hypothetical protein